MVVSLQTAICSVESRSIRLRALADQVAEGYAAIDPVLQGLCQKACVCCRDVCCRRATVWYDFQDLLFCYYQTGEFPVCQVGRLKEGDCMHLGADGCMLERVKRPFICSWYICPEQKGLVEVGGTLFGEIDRIKSVRKEMEREFMQQLTCS